MTHFGGLVLVDADKYHTRQVGSGEGRAFDCVSDLVWKYCESDEWGEDGTRYDWFEVGGRWSGLIDPDYDPDKDDRNYAPCKYCEGTGTTTQAVADKYPAYQRHVGQPCVQCNVGHDGKPKPRPGMAREWFNAPHTGDVKLARDIDIERLPFIPNVLVTPDGEWHERARFGMFASELPDEDGNPPKDRDEWAVEFCRLLDDNRDTIAVVVDFHV